VAKFGINMVKSVVKNPLPVIATIGLSFAAPGIASAMGLSKTFGTTIVNGIGRAAISAASGGNLSSIVAAGITPFFNSPEFSKALGGLGGGSVGKALTNITEFVSKPLTAVFGDTLGPIFTGALGDSSVAGLVAAVTGQDIVAAMGSEFASSAVSAGLARSWNALKTEVPRLLHVEADIDQKAQNAKIMRDTTPAVGKVQSLQYSINKNITDANASIDEYNVVYNKATAAYDRANLAETQADYDRDIAEYMEYERQANNIANKVNQLYVPSINAEKALLEAEYNANKSVIDDYISRVDEVGQLSKSYELSVGKVLGETTDLKMNSAIARGDFIEASKFYNELENINKSLLEIDPSAITVAPSIDLNSQTLLRDIYSASDETLKNQLIAQANLNQQFNDIRTNAPVLTPTPPTVTETPAPVEPTPEQPSIVDAVTEAPTPTEPTPTPPVEPTPVQPTIPETPAPVVPTPQPPIVPETPTTDDRAPGYADLPTLPEEGIGQPAPPAPTTPPSGSSTIGNIVSGVGNVAGNILENALIGAGTNAVVNEILGNEPPRRPPINRPRPPSKVDVSTLRPYTGSMFGQPTTPTTPPAGGLPTTPPAKVDPSTLTPYTGSLSFLGQTTTPPTNTTTQTPSGGLQSNQTQTPPTKVDVSRLTPVTDTNWLKSLGIA
jgi:tetratricopeptide (TPR) repeat protein